MITIRSPLKKTLLLITLTTLTIGLASAVTWNSPSDGDELQDPITMNVTLEATSDVNFSVDGPNSAEYTQSGSNGDYITQSFSAGSGNGGEYTLTAEDGSSSESIDITIDEAGPSIELNEDREYVGSDADLTFVLNDDVTGVGEVNISASDSDIIDTTENCDGDSECEIDVTLDTGSVDPGEDINIDVNAEDEVGNSNSNSFSFTLDDEWDGDSSASVEWSESGSNVLVGFSGEDQDVDISFQSDTVSDTSLTCEVDGEEIDTDSVSASDEDETASCEFDSIRSGSRFDLSVTAEDEAGNSQTLVEDKQMIWDTSAPSIDNLEQPEGVSTFNSEFSLSTLVSDDASGIETMEYYFDANTEVGDGTSISLDNVGAETVEKEFTVSPGDLGQGSKTVYIRAEDGTGQTAVESFDFEYFPDRDPSVNLGAPDSVEVTSGESTEFTLSIENGAPFFLNGVEVSGDGAVWNGTVTATNLEEGDSVEKVITVDASNLEVGEYDLVLETSDTGDSTTVSVVVRATESQKESIDSNLQDWQDRRSELEENISRIGTLETDNENITGFTEKLDNAESAIEDGNYYQAKSYLEDIDSSYSQASETFREKEEQHQINQRNKLFMLLFGGVILLGGGVFGFLFYRDGEMNLDIESLENELPDELPEVQELGIVDRVKDLVNRAEEEVEEETNHGFDGFN